MGLRSRASWFKIERGMPWTYVIAWTIGWHAAQPPFSMQ